MSVRNFYTTADYIPWHTAMSLVKNLYEDGDFRMSLLIGCGCFFGLRLRVTNFSTHSLRKTFARRVYENENAQGRGEMTFE